MFADSQVPMFRVCTMTWCVSLSSTSPPRWAFAWICARLIPRTGMMVHPNFANFARRLPVKTGGVMSIGYPARAYTPDTSAEQSVSESGRMRWLTRSRKLMRCDWS